MKFLQHVFLGIRTNDMMLAKVDCEKLIGRTLKCTNSLFYGGIHCHASLDDAGFELRLNHHDDGWGWRWCVDNPRYPLVLDCSFQTATAYERTMARLPQFEMIEVPRKT
jgi:hypothetical protein